MHTARLTILIAEDSAADRMLLSTIVSRQGHRVLSASNGLEALAMFQQERPHLILMDAMMPVMDGFEAASQLRPQFPDATLLILTANVQASSRNQAEALGVHFLAKPISAVIARQALALWGSEHA